MFSHDVSVKDRILHYLSALQSHMIQYIGVFEQEYSEIDDTLDQFIKHELPLIFSRSYDNQIEIYDALKTILALLNEESRSIAQKKSILVRLANTLKDSSSFEIHTELNSFIASIYSDDIEDAVLEENITAIERFINVKWLDEDQKSHFLYRACEENKEKSVKFLLNVSDIDVNYEKKYGLSNQGTTPLWIAVMKNHLNIVKLLKSSPGLYPNIPRTQYQIPPLHVAVKDSNIEMIKELLEIKEIRVDILSKNKTSNNKTPLRIAIDNNNLQVIEILLEAGADPKLVSFNKSTKQDILSLLQKNMQAYIRKSMIELGYRSNKKGMCDSFSIAIMLSVLSGEDVFLQLMRLLFTLRKLKLNEYDVLLKTDNVIPKEGYIYVKKTAEGIEYTVISPSGHTIIDTYKMTMDDDKSLTDDLLKTKLPEILKYTASKGHTKLSDLKIMQQQHNELIKQAEQDVLQSMECKSEDDLSELEKSTFRKLALQKTKELRNKLPIDKQQQEELLLKIKELFEPMEIFTNSHLYPTLFPMKNPHRGNQAMRDYVMQLIKPPYLEKKHTEIGVKKFNGCYTKDEFIHYFGKLRELIKKSDFIFSPIILNLNSIKHGINVIYRKTTDRWYFYDINEFPRNEQELKDFEFDDNKIIAEKVINNVCPDSQYAIISSNVFSVVENVYPAEDAWNDSFSVGEKKAEEMTKKRELLTIINQWYDELSSYHEITPAKAHAVVYNQGTFLYLAARSGDLKNTKKLIEMKADPSILSCKGKETPLHICAQNGPVEVFNILLESKEKIDINIQQEEDKATPLWNAVYWRQKEIVKAILTTKNVIFEVDPNLGNSKKQTPLHVVAFNGDISIAKELLDSKFQNHELDLNLIDDNGFTPLHFAAQQNHVEIVELLLNTNKIDLNKMTHCGHTALHIAIKKGNTSIAKLIERDLEPKVLQDKYQIKKPIHQNKRKYVDSKYFVSDRSLKIHCHANIGHLLFSTSSADHLKELIKMAWDTFMKEYHYQDSPLNKVLKRTIESDFDVSNLEKLMHAMGCEIRFLTFSKVSNRNNMVENLKNLTQIVNSLYTLSQTAVCSHSNQVKSHSLMKKFQY